MFTLMGNAYKHYKKKYEKSITLLIIGLDNAGKTTLLHALKGEVNRNITPTWGFSSEKVVHGSYKVSLFDVGGGAKIRGIWTRYLAEVHGVFFVVDSSDQARLEEAQKTLFEIVKDTKLQSKPVLIFANKQDKEGSIAAVDIANQMQLHDLKNISYHILEGSAIPKDDDSFDDSVKRALRWIVDAVDKDYKKLWRRVLHDTEVQKEEERKAKEEKRKRVEAMKEQRRLEREEEERKAAQAQNSQEESATGRAAEMTSIGPPLFPAVRASAALNPDAEAQPSAAPPAANADFSSSKEAEPPVDQQGSKNAADEVMIDVVTPNRDVAAAPPNCVPSPAKPNDADTISDVPSKPDAPGKEVTPKSGRYLTPGSAVKPSAS